MDRSNVPPSVAIAEGNSRTRTKALLLGVFTGLGSRVLVLAAPLLTIPVTLEHLGSGLFGFWMVATSFTSMAMFADLGLGNGLLTRLSACGTHHDQGRARALISTAYVTLGGLALVFSLLIWLGVPYIDWADAMDVGDEVEPAAMRTVATLCFLAFAVTIPLSLIQRVQYAYQSAWKSNVWQVAGAITTVVGVYVAAELEAGYALIIAVAVFSSPVMLLVNNVHHYSRRRDIRPSIRAVSSGDARSLIRIGFGFFLLSILTSISLNVDNWIVAEVAGLTAVSGYAVAAKLFSLLALAITLVALPLWPANGEALARGETRWVRRTTQRIMLLSVSTVALAGIVLVMARDLIARVWLGEGHTIAVSLAVSLAIWAVLIAFASPYFTVQNSVGLLRYQFIGWSLFAVASIPLKFYLYPFFGLAGVPLAGSTAYLLFLIPAALLGYRASVQGAGGEGAA